MTLKKFKEKAKRKHIDELTFQLEELKQTLKLAIRYYVENQAPTNSTQDLKYIKQLGKKLKSHKKY